VLANGNDPATIDATSIEVIAERVIAALRDDLDALAVELVGAASSDDQLTVEQVARRLGVARSTVYAHWREWGGYKLGAGQKARIRFDSSALPIVKPTPVPHPRVAVDASPKRARRRQRRGLLVAAPRLPQTLDGVPLTHGTAVSRADHS
jgi:transposase-like protein